MKSSWPELTMVEKQGIKKKITSRSLELLEQQFWIAIKNGEYQKADKCAKIYLYIKLGR